MGSKTSSARATWSSWSFREHAAVQHLIHHAPSLTGLQNRLRCGIVACNSDKQGNHSHNGWSQTEAKMIPNTYCLSPILICSTLDTPSTPPVMNMHLGQSPEYPSHEVRPSTCLQFRPRRIMYTICTQSWPVQITHWPSCCSMRRCKTSFWTTGTSC